MRLLEVNVIEHKDQRYPTWADWQWRDGCLVVTISRVEDWRYLFLSATHEFIEAILCRQFGITQDNVDAFDVDYENRRIAGEATAACGCTITDDPGSDIHAPYKAAHHAAELVEYGLAKLLGVDPKLYDAAFIALDGGVAGNRKWDVEPPKMFFNYAAKAAKLLGCTEDKIASVEVEDATKDIVIRLKTGAVHRVHM